MHEVIINGCDTLNGDTALTAAAAAGQNGSCLVLIRRGASLLVSDLKESFPLHMATRQGHWGVADTLLKEGADPNLLDGGQRSSLMIAALEGHLGLCELLISRGARLDTEDRDGLSGKPFFENKELHIAAHRALTLKDGKKSVLKSNF